MHARAFLALLLLPGPALAHDLWLLPPEGARPGALELRAAQGMDFPNSEAAPKVERFAKAWLVDPAGASSALKAAKADGNFGVLLGSTKAEGLYIAAAESTPKVLAMSAEDFNHYLVVDGMPHIYAQRHADGTLDQPARERYMKSVKLMFEVGRGAGDYARVLGQPLEIIPLLNPFSVSQGEMLPIRVLLRGAPLEGARVGLDLPNDGGEPTAILRTDAKGEVLVPILRAGPTTLRLTHIERVQAPDVEWVSLWTTLTFSVGPKDPTALALDRVADVHGAAGPFAMAGYRIGEDALARLGARRGSFSIRVRHVSPDEMQYSCVADGLQAATGASPGKMSLSRETGDSVVTEVSLGDRTLRYRLTKSFYSKYLEVPRPQLRAAAREVATLPAAAVFVLDAAE